jgi:hypothetical protein
MYSKEFLESLGLDPVQFDPDCDSVSTESCCEPFDLITGILTF